MHFQLNLNLKDLCCFIINICLLKYFGLDDGSIKLADMLLFREFARRPKRQNNSETQGLVKIGYSGLEKIKKCPDHWERYGFTLQDCRFY